jgi:hypothetical protein
MYGVEMSLTSLGHAPSVSIFFNGEYHSLYIKVIRMAFFIFYSKVYHGLLHLNVGIAKF